MKLWVTGLNHRTAPVSVRERLAFDHRELANGLAELKSMPGIVEGLILSTCNRVEVAITADDDVDPQRHLKAFLAAAKELDTIELHKYLYGFEGREAIRHLFRVASSLDSMIVGEPQILGQLKSAYSLAKQHGAVTGLLDTVLTRAFGVAKRVRTETDIGVSAVSISYAAVELAREIFGSLKTQRVMLIGAGKMSELAARHLLRSGVQEILVTNRTDSRAKELAEMVRGTIVHYDQFRTRLKDVDIVITSSGAPDHLLEKEDVRRVLHLRKNRPMFLIDIAVPRNIAPDVNELAHVFLYDIDDLQRIVDENLKGRMDQAAEADKIVSEEVDRLEMWLRTRHVGPMIVSLQEHLEQIRTSEIERVKGRLGPLTEQQQQAIDAMTRGIVNKIAHGPISQLRKHASGDDAETMLSTIRNMFRLEE